MDRVIIIAEACQNHNGQLKKAYQLVDVAKKCGVDLHLTAPNLKRVLSWGTRKHNEPDA